MINNNNQNTPPPGSNEAVELGCKCPVLDNARGIGYYGNPGVYVYQQGCPVHTGKEKGDKANMETRSKIEDKAEVTEMREMAEKLNKTVEASLRYWKENDKLNMSIQNCLVDANYGMGTVVNALRELETEVAEKDKTTETDVTNIVLEIGWLMGSTRKVFAHDSIETIKEIEEKGKELLDKAEPGDYIETTQEIADKIFNSMIEEGKIVKR